MTCRPGFFGMCVVLGLCSGCSLQVRARPGPGVVLIRDGKGAVAEQGGVSVFVRYAEVPWATRNELIGFFVEITNRAEAPLQVRLEQMVLIDPAERRRLPESPTQMLDAFRGAQVDDRPIRFQVAVSSNYAHGCGYPYYSWPYRYYSYHDPYYDAEYYERRAQAKFLSRLLWSRDVKPREVAGGNVVFQQRIEKGDELGVELTLNQVLGSTEAVSESQPALESNVTESGVGATSRPVGILELRPIRFTFGFDVG